MVCAHFVLLLPLLRAACDRCVCCAGIFLCLGCASKHRGYGVQASFVRSMTLDRWQVPQQTEYLRLGGNTRYREFFAANEHELPDQHKCRCDVCDRYRALLAADVRRELEARGVSTDQPAVRQASSGDGDDDDYETICVLPEPRSAVQTGEPQHEAAAPTSTWKPPKLHRGVGSDTRPHIDEEEERRLFGESFADSDTATCDCCRSCGCTLL